MVKIYIDKLIDNNIASYAFQELFRYIDIDFEVVNDIKNANIIYNFEKNNVQEVIYINASEQFWNNYKKIESLPSSPLFKDSNELTYIYKDDIISSTFFMLSGYEEYLNLKRDKFVRFLYKYSHYKNDGIYKESLVEKYREVLIKNLNDIGIVCNRKNIWGDNQYGVFLSHDVDGVYKYRYILKSLAKIILKPSKFRLKELIKSKKDTFNDPYFKGFDYLIESSKKYGFKSTFFFITKVREKLDDFYHIDNKTIKEIMTNIKLNGFEIGVHGSLESFDNLDYLKEEKSILKNCYAIRQHYLKYDIKSTSKTQNELFKYDSTLGFADMIGFRRGTCMPFRLYDLETDTQLNLIEIPLLVMEQTLKNYMKLNPNEAYIKVFEIINEIKQYNGLFTFLWHPGNCSDEWIEWIENVYFKVLLNLKEESQESLVGSEIIKRVQND